MSAARESSAGKKWEHHQLGRYEVATSTEFGPRITGLWVDDSTNFLAVLGPEVRIQNSVRGDFIFHGGHRLWVAPETPEVTHVPDDNICRVTSTRTSVEVAAEPDRAGFAKSIEITTNDDHLIVDHRVTWTGGRTAEASPWAITQLAPGGTAILPLPSNPDSSFQADRTIVLWPYTRLDDPRIKWRGDAVLMQALPGGQLKFGAGPEARRLGYLRDGYLFGKWFQSSPEGRHSDRGATAQIFLNDDFCELETLGPLQNLESGSSITHREFWEVGDCATVDEAIEILLSGEAA